MRLQSFLCKKIFERVAFSLNFFFFKYNNRVSKGPCPSDVNLHIFIMWFLNCNHADGMNF
jgi:hypothetical protein